MKQFVFASLAVLAMAVCGSAAADDYQASSAPNSPGYFSAVSENGLWVVGYTGGPSESAEEIAEYALRRAGEVAAEQSQEWFAVLDAANYNVDVGVADDLAVRAGNFMGLGPSRATFGGELVPANVLERWQPRQARQTVLVIQLGSGDSASFPAASAPPQIFPAASAAQAN